MRESSFCGCCSLKSGTFIIGILYLICEALLWHCIDYPYYDFHQWSPFFITLIPLTILLLFGAIKRNVDFVFPSICMHFVIILMLISHITNQFIRTSFLRFSYKENNIILLCETIAFFLMIYFFSVIFAFYQELLHEKFTSLLSIDNSAKTKKAMNIQSILNNFEYEQTIKKNSDKEAIIKYEDSKKSMV